MELEWWSVDFKTGELFGRVQVRSGGTLSRFISMGTDANVDVRCSHDGVEVKGWDEATQKRRKVLIAVDATNRQIVWGGLVRRRTSGIGPWVTCSLDSLERYFNRRYIGQVFSWTDADVAQMAADVLAPIAAEIDPLEVQATMTGNTLSAYFDTNDNKRVGTFLQDLAGMAVGIEWTVELEWADADHTQVRYVVRIGPRLGRGGPESGGPDPAGWTPTSWVLGPNGGCVKEFEFIEDDGEETGANDTLALSSGEGDSKPRSTRYEATDLLVTEARFERRFTPVRSIKDTRTLDQYAEADHAATREGYTQLTLTAGLAAAPQVNLDWWLGDDLDVELTCERFPARVDSDGYWAPGYVRRLRAIGWELDLEARTIKPRIQEAG